MMKYRKIIQFRYLVPENSWDKNKKVDDDWIRQTSKNLIQWISTSHSWLSTWSIFDVGAGDQISPLIVYDIEEEEALKVLNKSPNYDFIISGWLLMSPRHFNSNVMMIVEQLTNWKIISWATWMNSEHRVSCARKKKQTMNRFCCLKKSVRALLTCSRGDFCRFSLVDFDDGQTEQTWCMVDSADFDVCPILFK